MFHVTASPVICIIIVVVIVIQASELKSGSCYTFSVTVTNKVGNGQPSLASDEVCTLKSSCVGEDCPDQCSDEVNCRLNGKHIAIFVVSI